MCVRYRPRRRSGKRSERAHRAAATGAPIVLVHGAWVGEWCWEPIVELLEAAGRPVYAVSLTGHGARRDESGPHVTLGDHVADVVAVFDEHDLVDATLVGHSYGGRVITKAWPQAGAESAADWSTSTLTLRCGPEAAGERRGDRYAADGTGMIPFGEFHPDAAVLGGADAVAGFYDRLTPQSAPDARRAIQRRPARHPRQDVRVRQCRAIDAVPSVRCGRAT